MTSHGREIALIFFFVFSVVCADITPWKYCPAVENEAPNTHCNITELRVTPCKEAAEGKPCRVKREKNATIEFDFVTDFAAETLEGRAYWASGVLDLPFLGMDTNACASTACPITPGQKHTYHMELPISPKYPLRAYDVKWKLEGPQEQECCFIFQIRILKKDHKT